MSQVAQSIAVNSSKRLDIAPMSPVIGAEISGVDLSEEIDDATISEIRAALLTHKVIFFRDQHISRAQHIAFARRFGELEVHPATATDQADPEVFILANGPDKKSETDLWHSDVTWRAEPSLGSVLRAIEVPESGGDTLFSDMGAAFRGLSSAMQDWLRSLEAVHTIPHVFSRKGGKELEEMLAKFPPQTHPVVRTHPETGEQALYVNTAFTGHIEGLSAKESEWLLEHLYAQASKPEYQCRFRWQPGSIAFWDNRAVQHYAASDYFPAVRVMERVTIAGDQPFYEDERG